MHACMHTDMQTYRHTDIQTYRHTDIQTYRQHRSHELGYLLSVQKCRITKLIMKHVFKGSCTKKRGYFDDFGRKSGTFPPSSQLGHDQVNSAKIAPFFLKNRPVIIRKSIPKIINQSNDSPDNCMVFKIDPYASSTSLHGGGPERGDHHRIHFHQQQPPACQHSTREPHSHSAALTH